MKNKNIFYTLVILGIIVIATPYHTFALKQAIFPDTQSLQPLPPDVYANVSGNTNSTTPNPSLSESDVTTENNNESVPTEKSLPVTEWSGLLLWGCIIGLCIIGFFVYRKFKKDETIS